MKKIVALIILLIMSSCKSGLITEKLKKGNDMFEKFNFEKWEKDNIQFKEHEYSSVYILKDSTKMYINDNEINILPQKPFFYVEYKEFYNNSFIKIKGKYFGRFDVGSNSTKIGMWYEFDEKGNLIKETNEDNKFGKFGYNELLNFLNQKGEISLSNGKNRENLEIDFYFSKISNEKLWEARLKIGKPYEQADSNSISGLTSIQKGKSYHLDGNTGEIVKYKDLIKYKAIIPNFERNYPDLK